MPGPKGRMWCRSMRDTVEQHAMHEARERCLADKELMERLERRFERTISLYERICDKQSLPTYEEGQMLTPKQVFEHMEASKLRWAAITAKIPEVTASLIAQTMTARELAEHAISLCVGTITCHEWVVTVRRGRKMARDRLKKARKSGNANRIAREEEGSTWPCCVPEYTRNNNRTAYVIRHVRAVLDDHLPIMAVDYFPDDDPINKKQRAPNVEVAMIASAILDKEVTAGDVVNAMRRKRRKYSPQPGFYVQKG